MSIPLMIVFAVAAICFLVFIHEAGHFLAARAFGVRVTELMLGLPGPGVGFTHGGTRYGVTVVLLGGYARVCGMEPGEMSPHLKPALASLYRRGTATAEEVAFDCGISVDDAIEALDELTEWGSCSGPTKKDEFNTYRACEVKPTKRQQKRALAAGSGELSAFALGQPRAVEDPDALFESEYARQYRSLPFWKRSVILLAGVAMNLLFAMLIFIVVYSVIGVDLTYRDTGEVFHYNATPLMSIQLGFSYILATVQAVLGLFNPATAAETVSNSASIVGIVAMSGDFFERGLADSLFFAAVISVSLGIMNLLPIPPLDGGRFVVEVFQKITRKVVSVKVMGYASMAGMALFLCFFAIMLNQDIQRILTGFWS